MAGIEYVHIPFRGTDWDELPSSVALKIHEIRVIVSFSCEMTVFIVIYETVFTVATERWDSGSKLE